MLTMARKAIRSDYENVLLTNVPEKLLEARNIVRDVPNEILDFCEFLATVVNKDLIPVGLIRSLNYALDDIIEETCNFSRAKSLPDVVKRKKYDIITNLSYFPLIVDKIASPKFAEEFRRLFVKEFPDARRRVDSSNS